MHNSTIKQKTEAPCKCGCGNIVKLNNFNSIEPYFKDHKLKHKGAAIKKQYQLTIRPKRPRISKVIFSTKPINKMSARRRYLLPIYTAIVKKKIEENPWCYICKCRRAEGGDHRAGKGNYAYYDEWSRQNDIPLYIDERFIEPCCNKCNGELENNSELKAKHHLSKIHGGKLEPKNV